MNKKRTRVRERPKANYKLRNAAESAVPESVLHVRRTSKVRIKCKGESRLMPWKEGGHHVVSMTRVSLSCPIKPVSLRIIVS